MAINTTAVWEIRPTFSGSSDQNGGGFDSGIAGSGTDYTLQGAAQVAVTDATTNNTTTVTSATAAFTSAMIGNAVYLSGGGTTTGRYFITAVVSATQITVDRATGGAGAANQTLNLGGSLATLAEAFSVRGGIGSNSFYVKNTGTLLVTVTMTPPAGTSGKPTVVAGYNATRGDLDAVATFANHPTIQTNNAAITIFTNSNALVHYRNFILDGTGGATKGTNGWACGSGGDYALVENCKAIGFTTAGFILNSGDGIVRRCWATAMGAGANAAFKSAVTGSIFDCCVASSNTTCPGFVLSASTGNFVTCINCIASSNTGANNDGFQVNLAGGNLINCIAYNNGRDGIRLATTGGNMSLVQNCIMTKNAGWGLNATTAWTEYPAEDYNFFWSNTSGAFTGVPGGPHDKYSGTVDPFNAAGTDFSLNGSPGGGQSCKAVAFPGTYSGIATTGYLDIGAAQHQDPSGTAAIFKLWSPVPL